MPSHASHCTVVGDMIFNVTRNFLARRLPSCSQLPPVHASLAGSVDVGGDADWTHPKPVGRVAIAVKPGFCSVMVREKRLSQLMQAHAVQRQAMGSLSVQSGKNSHYK